MQPQPRRSRSRRALSTERGRKHHGHSRAAHDDRAVRRIGGCVREPRRHAARGAAGGRRHRATQAVRLGRRPHPLPLDPFTWEALTDVLAYRASLGATDPRLYVTTHTARRRLPISTTYLHLLFGPL